MTKTLTAHPTMYGGVCFRSRLEARWAAFFDLAGWRWEYEPLDLQGWTPDFLLLGASLVKVEVKPILWTGDENEMFKYVRHAPELEKVRRYIKDNIDIDHAPECSGEQIYDNIFGGHEQVLVLGAYPHTYGSGGWSAEIALGVFPCEHVCLWEDTAILGTGFGNRKLDFAAGSNGCYRYRMGGEYGGGHTPVNSVTEEEVQRLWRQAGNAVQWQPNQLHPQGQPAA
jgi:hypothetical protein